MPRTNDHPTHRPSETREIRSDDPIQRTFELSKLLDRWASGEISYRQVKETFSSDNETRSTRLATEPPRQ